MHALTTDVKIYEFVRKFFTDSVGRLWAENVYHPSALPSLERVKFSGRPEDLALYIYLYDPNVAVARYH